MNIVSQSLLGAIVTASILNISGSVSAFSIVFGERDTTNTRTDFIDSFDTNISSTVIDDGMNFGAAPATGSVASVDRTGTIGAESFSYTIYDIDFNTAPTGSITPGIDNPINDILELDNITVETPANQQTANGNYGWGVDSGSGGKGNSPNAALFDFGSQSIGHFGIDLHDFEAGAGIDSTISGASGEIRLYQSGSLVHSYSLQFPGVDGGGSTDNPNNSQDKDSAYKGYGNRQSMFVGIVANNPDEFFNQVAFVVGDDDVGDDGYSEQWAADGFTFGSAYREVPLNFSPSLGLFMVSGFYVIRIIKRKLN